MHATLTGLVFLMERGNSLIISLFKQDFKSRQWIASNFCTLTHSKLFPAKWKPMDLKTVIEFFLSSDLYNDKIHFFFSSVFTVLAVSFHLCILYFSSPSYEVTDAFMQL